MTSDVELRSQRKITAAFINSAPVEIILTPREMQKTSTGGRKYTEQPPRLPQTFKIVEHTSSASSTRVPGGEEQETEFTLVGYHDAQIGALDIFTLRGSQWEVTEVLWHNGWETRAEVTRFGR